MTNELFNPLHPTKKGHLGITFTLATNIETPIIIIKDCSSIWTCFRHDINVKLYFRFVDIQISLWFECIQDNNMFLLPNHHLFSIDESINQYMSHIYSVWNMIKGRFNGVSSSEILSDDKRYIHVDNSRILGHVISVNTRHVVNTICVIKRHI